MAEAEVIDAERALELTTEALSEDGLVAWIVYGHMPDAPHVYTAQLTVRGSPRPFILMASSLPGIHAQLPPALARTPRGRSDPPDLVETWFVP